MLSRPSASGEAQDGDQKYEADIEVPGQVRPVAEPGEGGDDFVNLVGENPDDESVRRPATTMMAGFEKTRIIIEPPLMPLHGAGSGF